MKKFKTLIFDLGNVIIDIDYQTTVAEFQKIAVTDFNEILSYTSQIGLFDQFEKGKFSAEQFRDEVRRFLLPTVTDEQINNAWNAILINYPEAKFKMLKELKQQYRTYALSNINEIHADSINKAVMNKFNAGGMGDYFHGLYYSNEMGFRKPEKEIYELIITKENLIPAETFFVDDKIENIEAAKTFGLQAYQLTERDELFELLKDFAII